MTLRPMATRAVRVELARPPRPGRPQLVGQAHPVQAELERVRAHGVPQPDREHHARDPRQRRALVGEVQRDLRGLADLGFGRIVVSEIEAPTFIFNINSGVK